MFHSRTSTLKLTNLGCNTGQSPCAKVITQAEKYNETIGHENLGSLSYRSGFMPAQYPLDKLPQSHNAWDALADDLSRLLRDQILRYEVNAMPEIPADRTALPDIYLQRASTVLGIVAHAYVHMDMSGPTALPSCLQKPWDQVNKRLGRDIAGLSYIDLIVYNWKKIDPEGDFCVENLSLLVPTVNNAEENIFYLAQAELLWRATPLLCGVVDAQSAVLRNDAEALLSTLRTMTECLSDLVRKSLVKITANHTRPTYVDPVIWAKSVAPLAAPLRAEVPGPGGIASPLFHLMDAFIGRTAYNVILGEEARRNRANYPPHWRYIIAAAGEVNVATFVASTRNSELARLWEMLKAKYRGSMGLLGTHRRKVFAYLPMSFKVGFRGETAEEEWFTVHQELEKSRQERFLEGETSDETRLLRPQQPLPKSYAISSLVEHSNAALGFWFVANNRVYDATSYLRMHPGGDKIIINSSGRDITKDLIAVSHLQERTIADKLSRFAIGYLDTRHFESEALREIYDFSVAMAYKITDLYTTFHTDASILKGKLTSNDTPGVMTAQKQRFFIMIQQRVGTQYVPSIASHAAVVAMSLGLDIARRFNALLQATGDSFATVHQISATLEACKVQAVVLLRAIESVSLSAHALPASRKYAAQQALNCIATHLESLGMATKDT